MKIRVFILASLLFTLAACSDDGGDSRPVEEEYIVKGNPELIVAGATLNPKGLFTANKVHELEEYSLTTALSFVEKSKKEKKPKDQSELEEENAAPEHESQDVSYKMKITTSSDNTYFAEIEQLQLQLVFKAGSDGILQLTQLGSSAETTPVRTLHWSQTPDKAYFSVLVAGQSPKQGRLLVALYFRNNSKVKKKDIPIYEKTYLYLAGPGVGVKWDQEKPVQIKACGDADESFAEEAINSWSQSLEGRLNLKFGVQKKFPPFSDLNQRCIYRTHLYKEDAFGITATIIDMRGGQIKDSDIIIFDNSLDNYHSETRKANPDISNDFLKSYIKGIRTITYHHEVGHLLGLSHQFTGKQSIMSYDFDSATLTYYDVNAVQTLYPKLESESKKKDRIKK